MFTILNKQIIGNDVKRLDIFAETIARRVDPGQFVMVIPRENGEWIPLPIIESDSRRGTITVMFREESAATQQLAAIPIKENVYAITGPLGQPSVCTKKVGLVVCVASGLGVGQILPVVRQLTKLGNKVIGVIGAKNRRELLLEPQIRLACHKIHTVTNESVIKGGELGMVNQILDQQPINMVYAAGSVEMMQSLAVKTKEKKVPFFIQVYPMMCCGMGFCGSCRMRVNNQIILACEEGPEFDGHKVDFADLRLRLNAYEKTERALAPARKLEVTSSSGPVQRDKFSKFFTDLLKS